MMSTGTLHIPIVYGIDAHDFDPMVDLNLESGYAECDYVYVLFYIPIHITLSHKGESGCTDALEYIARTIRKQLQSALDGREYGDRTAIHITDR